MNVEVSIRLDNEFLERTKKESEKQYQDWVGELDLENPEELKGRTWDDLKLSDVEWDLNGDALQIWGDLDKGEGQITVDLTLPVDLSLQIIEVNIKKLNKLKTVLEAVK